jgi:four helix bundle protein
MPFQFEKLLVYKKALDFADEVCQLTSRFDRGFGFIADQLNRAALSVSTNLAEGNGRLTKADRRNFFTIARDSLQECVPLLEFARRRGQLSEDIHYSLKAHLEEISGMLARLITGLRIEPDNIRPAVEHDRY